MGCAGTQARCRRHRTRPTAAQQSGQHRLIQHLLYATETPTCRYAPGSQVCSQHTGADKAQREDLEPLNPSPGSAAPAATPAVNGLRSSFKPSGCPAEAASKQNPHL